MTRNTFKFLLFNRWSAFLHDLLWVPVALVLAYWLRFNLEVIPETYQSSLTFLIVVGLFIQGTAYWVFGLYRGLWRFASIPDLFRIIKAVILGTLLVAIVAFFVTRLVNIPRSVFILYPILLTVGLCLPRFIYRWYKDHHIPLSLEGGKRVLIVGAGQAGELLLRDLIHRKDYQPVAFLDDDTSKHGREIHGVRVVGGLNEIGRIADVLDVEEVLVAIPSATKTVIQRIAELCGNIGIQIRILPSLLELTGSDVNSSQLRPVTVEDLLGREPVTLDIEAISDYLRGKNVLVSGGGGSIGSELCRQIVNLDPAQLIILDNSEFNLYSIDHELRENYTGLHLESVLGDVRNKDRINWIFESFAPNVVFHAAAYKHVPMIESNPAEGVMNNVKGTKVLADAADHFGVERFVLVSTDKAVNPSNVMGTTKRIAELYCQNLAVRSKTKFITTRFGNVLGSAGSVVPLFQKQIEKGGPVTVTHRDITRYFMTIPEAVSLILQAGSMGIGGEIFVLDMGAPVLIRDLAEQMIKLSGYVAGEDIDIVYTGLRPGEKLYEEILHENEGLQETSHIKLLLANCRQVEWDWLTEELVNLENAAQSRDVELLKMHLKNIVPEFQEQV